MKTYIIFVAVFFPICGIISCDFPEKNGKIPFGKEFRVEYDQAVILADDIELKFLELKKDTRCPEDALCPYEGEAIIAVALEYKERLGTVLELRIPGLVDRYSDGRHTPEEYRGYVFTLLQLDPYPLTDHIERKHRYVATLKVEKVNGEGLN